MSQTSFDQLTYQYFSPNPFIREKTFDAKDKAMLETKRKELDIVVQYLKADTFHVKFSNWLNYDSIWMFYNKDEQSNLFDKMYTAHASFLPELKEYDYLKNKKTFGEVFLLDNNLVENTFIDLYLQELSVVLKVTYDKGLMNETFFPDLSIVTNTGNISQTSPQSTFSRTDTVDMKNLRTVIADNGINIETFSSAISFVKVLSRISKNNFNLNSIPNLHDHILKINQEASTKSNYKEKYMMVQNACFHVYNELLYTKVHSKNILTKEIELKFLFHTGGDSIDNCFLSRVMSLYFNIHMIKTFKDNIIQSQKFPDINISEIEAAHVSIARLKYLIQDYFKLIEEYNNKSHPDKEDIINFWEKRVSSFGMGLGKHLQFPVVRKQNRQRQYANTSIGLFLNYLSAVIRFKHPDIPFFQSTIALVRGIILPPNDVINSFMAQIKGEQPPVSTNQLKYNFNFEYSPQFSAFSNSDSFVSLEDSAKRLNDVNDLEAQKDFEQDAQVANKSINKNGGKALNNVNKTNVEAVSSDAPTKTDERLT
jgi:hypothetical protein